MFSRCLQHVFSAGIFLLPRRLHDVFKTSSRCICKTSWKTKNCYAWDVLKTSSRHVLKTSSRRLQNQQMFAGDPFKVTFWHFRVFWWKCAKFLVSFSKPQVSFSSNFVSLFSVMEDNSSELFLAQTLYTLIKRSPLKCKFLRLLSAWAKICQISQVNFETTSQFAFKFCMILQCHETWDIFLYFFS